MLEWQWFAASTSTLCLGIEWPRSLQQTRSMASFKANGSSLCSRCVAGVSICSDSPFLEKTNLVDRPGEVKLSDLRNRRTQCSGLFAERGKLPEVCLLDSATMYLCASVLQTDTSIPMALSQTFHSFFCCSGGHGRSCPSSFSMSASKVILKSCPTGP